MFLKVLFIVMIVLQINSVVFITILYNINKSWNSSHVIKLKYYQPELSFVLKLFILILVVSTITEITIIKLLWI